MGGLYRSSDAGCSSGPAVALEVYVRSAQLYFRLMHISRAACYVIVLIL